MKSIFTLLCVFIFGLHITNSQTWQSYPYIPSNSVLKFPDDDGVHPAATTEWWYLNLHLVGAAPKYRKYDVMLCYFNKPSSLRIFNMMDLDSGIFHTHNKKTPNVLFPQSGHWEFDYIPNLLHDSSHWTFPQNNKTFSYFFHAQEINKNDELNVTVSSNRIPLIVGGDGFIPIGEAGDSSFYYSLTNMKVEGTLKFNGVKDSITAGIGWIDRQWGPFSVGINKDNQYEWFSLQLDVPSAIWGVPQQPVEFNIWQVYSDSNSVPYTPASRMVSFLPSNNIQDTSSAIIVERTGYWHEPIYNKYYSRGWRFIHPGQEINIDMQAAPVNQIIDVTLFRFWEGSTYLKGTIGQQKVSGVGFAELLVGHNSEILPPSIPNGLSVTPDNGNNVIQWMPATAGTYPIGGYRVFRSTNTDGYWKYLGTVTGTTFTDYLTSPDSVYYSVSSFDNQSSTSASGYAAPAKAGPLTFQHWNNIPAVDVFPNPAEKEITVEIGNSRLSTIEIFSVDGRLLSQEQHTGGMKLNIDFLSSGMYFLKVSQEEGVALKRFIKE